MSFKVEGVARVAFTNTPGQTPSAPDNGEIKVQQADGALITRRSNGTVRVTDIRDIFDQLATGPLSAALAQKADLVNGVVPLAQLPSGLGGGGPTTITASQITNSSVSGRAILTGLPADARGALELGTAARLNVGVSGGVAAYDDPRIGAGGGGGGAPSTVTASQISDGSVSGRSVITGTPAQARTALELINGDKLSFDRAVTGSRPRTHSQVLGDAVNVMEFLSDAMIAGTADAGPALNACMTYCRSSGRTTAVVPSFPGVILINTPVNYQGVHISGPGRGGPTEAHFRTTADITTFFSDGPSTGLSGLRVSHWGNGKIVNLPRSLNHIVCDNMFYATNSEGMVSTATTAMFAFGGSNYFFRNNFVTNLRTNAYTIEAVRSTDDICINNSIATNYFGGTGKGILVASVGNYVVGDASHAPGSPIHRQEGIEISGNQSILTGGAFIELSSVLNLRILNNMIDQAPTQGGILFVPQGSIDALSIYGVLILGNYISTAQDTANGIGINHLTGSGNSVRGVTIVGNEICFCGEGAYFGENSGPTIFSANIFHSLSKQTCVRTSSTAVAQTIMFSRTNAIDGFGLKVNSIGTNGQFRSTFSVASATNDGTWAGNSFAGRTRFINIPHLLAMTPALDTIQIQCRLASDAAEAAFATVLSADNTNVTAKISVFGLAADTTVTVAMKCAITGPNS